MTTIELPESGRSRMATWGREDSLAVGDGTFGSTRPAAVGAGTIADEKLPFDVLKISRYRSR
jgi:hypothetical protein